LATKYRVYFTVSVELIGIEVLTRDSPSKEVSGSPPIQSEIAIVSEMPVWGLLIAVTTASLSATISKKAFKQTINEWFSGNQL
jgi:hypothetical protein